MTRIPKDALDTFKRALEVNERPALVGELFFKLLAEANYSSGEIRAAVATVIQFVDRGAK